MCGCRFHGTYTALRLDPWADQVDIARSRSGGVGRQQGPDRAWVGEDRCAGTLTDAELLRGQADLLLVVLGPHLRIAGADDVDQVVVYPGRMRRRRVERTAGAHHQQAALQPSGSLEHFDGCCWPCTPHNLARSARLARLAV